MPTPRRYSSNAERQAAYRARKVFDSNTFGKSSWVETAVETPTPLSPDETRFLLFLRAHPSIQKRFMGEVSAYQEFVTRARLQQEPFQYTPVEDERVIAWDSQGTPTMVITPPKVTVCEEENDDEPKFNKSRLFRLTLEVKQKTSVYGLTLSPNEARKLTTALTKVKGVEWELSQVKREEPDMKKTTLENILKIL